MARKAAKRKRRRSGPQPPKAGERRGTWWQAPSTVVQRDGGGTLRHIAHLQTPFADPGAKTPEALVLAYLRSGIGAAFGLTQDHLDRLAKQLQSAAPGFGIADEFQFVRPSREIRRETSGTLHIESTVVTIKQAINLPSLDPKQATDIWQCGLRVSVSHGADGIMRIYAIGGAVRAAMQLAPQAVDSQFFKEFTKEQLAALLNQSSAMPLPFRVAKYVLPAQLDGAEPSPARKRRGAKTSREARDQDIPVWGVFAADHNAYEPIPRRIFVAAPGIIVAMQDLVSCGVGSIFRIDPTSRTGNRLRDVEDVGLRPSLPSATLDYWRDEVTLQDNPVHDGETGTITGDLIRLVPYHPVRTRLPAPDALGNYRWPSRTDGIEGPNDPTRIDGFAAVSAYHHCNQMFRLVERFGFALDEYFRPEPFPEAPAQFPMTVYPRAAIMPGPAADGHSMGGQVMQDVHFKFRTADIRFALADMADPLNPLGIAADNRWAWHEFGHVLLVAGQDALEFSFAHSMGDALAAIMCDPESAFAEARSAGDSSGPWGLTYPWELGELRRHDRLPADGWSWHGAIYRRARYPRVDDPWGYWAEQLVSSSLFRLYRALGGDARLPGTPGGADPARRRVAARHTAYLIVRAAKSLTDASIAPIYDATEFAADLQAADIATPRLDYRDTDPADPAPAFARTGGTLPKVIRWAFERQGLYPQPGTAAASDGSGAPPEIDVFIDDGRRGEYGFTDTWQATAQALWVRRRRDGMSGHQNPKANKTNYVYLNVTNRGFAPAAHTRAVIYAAPDSAAAAWTPAQWSELKLASGGSNDKTIAPGQTRRFGPFEWDRPVAGTYSLIAKVSAPGDLPNVDVAGYPCASAHVSLAELVPYDNNLGLRAGIAVVR